MNLRMKSYLRDVIQKWADEACNSDAWEQSGIYFGENTVDHMTDAAASVFDGICEAQRYERQQQPVP